MVKSGPCCHCGITSTPLWRNGPPRKPVLCNACGSRWRTRGTLKNYTPLHARGFRPDTFGVYKYSHEHKIPSKRKLQNMSTISESEHVAEIGESVSRHEPLEKGFEDEGSNSSSSGSRISFSESYVPLGSINGNDISGSTQPSFWDSYIPSQKRTGHKRIGPSPVEKLRRDLYGILQEQGSSLLSGSSEEVLIYVKEEDSTPFVETSLGSVLIKRPLSSAEEESEGSSLPMENKVSCSNDAYMESQSSKSSSSTGVKCEVIWNAGEGGETIGNPAEQCALSNSALAAESKCES